ncbi:MAG: pectin acetylesterase-family hydrolase, partial [Candidatus Hydrogenedentes bacterium]|nr:pectin acetylesterase-family hydrolase [Candidatus Hydrogenedentota bacterium]
MNSNEEKVEVSPKGHRRPMMFIVAGALLIGVMVAAGFAGGRMLGPKKSETPATLPVSNVNPIDEMRAFAQCMRDHGIANFPDPTNDGINLNGTGVDPESPEFQAAKKACEALLPEPMRQAAPARESGREGRQVRRIGTRGNSAWQKVVPGGDCACADGSEFAFWDHKADPDKVVFYLDGGGVCFDAASCANQNTPGTEEREGPDYDPNIDGENPGSEGGMFDFSRADNPFRDYSFIYVPLCTADSHLGNVTREYSPGLTVEHKGFVNGTAALGYLTEHYPDATQVVVLGKTAGAAAAPIYGGLIADRLSNAHIIVFGAQCGAFPDDPDLNAKIGELWGAFNNIPDWEVNKGLTARDWGVRRFWIQTGLHGPAIVMARFDYAFDPNATETLKYLSLNGIDPENTLALIDANDA